MADWEEVKRLAADFQRTQLTETLKRLSERNCIEIVKKLQELELLDVIYTCDGREYITHSHLLKEVEDEIYYNNGRVPITDVATSLNVDYVHVEAKAQQLARESHGEISLVMGQLLNRRYKDMLAQEVDLKLQEEGCINIGELTKVYDLPADFLENAIVERLDTLVNGKQDQHDSKIIVTEKYLKEFQAQITGVLSGCTRPISFNQLISKYKFPERIFNSTITSLISSGRLSGCLSGRNYIPDIYARTQVDYVDSFYKQNGYLDYATLTRLGVANAEAFLTKKYGDARSGGELCYLESCAVGPLVVFQVESAIEENCVNNKNWVDLTPLLPSYLSEEDIGSLIQLTISLHEQLKKELDYNVNVFCKTIVVSNSFINKLHDYFTSIMKKKADDDFKTGLLLKHFALQRQGRVEVSEDKKATPESSKQQKKGARKSAGGGGAGSQGREVKTKAVKKKYTAGKKQQKGDADTEHDSRLLEFLSVDEIVEVLQKNIANVDECPEEFLVELAEHLFDALQAAYNVQAEEHFKNMSVATEATKKKSFNEVQKIVNQTYNNIIMFEKGLQVLEGDLQSQLTKYLLRSLCSDVVNQLVLHLSTEESATIATPEARLKLINKLDAEFKECFVKLNNSLNSKSLDDFHVELENCCKQCDILLKKVDKKKERVLLSENRQNLLVQLNESPDPALTLHIAVMLQLQTVTDQMVHASGKFVPALVSFLRPKLNPEVFALLHQCQELVMKSLTVKDDQEKAETDAKLEEMLPKIKEVAVRPKD